jgi:hypothetical protein
VMDQTIATIGYEETAVESFIAVLKHALIDMSRKKGLLKHPVGADLSGRRY